MKSFKSTWLNLLCGRCDDKKEQTSEMTRAEDKSVCVNSFPLRAGRVTACCCVRRANE